MILRTEVTDAALFLYPEFVAKANSLDTPGKGFKLTPSSQRPGSTVESVVMSKTTAECVVNAIDCAVATLSEDCQAIVSVKYGWCYEGDRLVTSEPMGTNQTYEILHKMGVYNWCDSYYKNDLAEIRKRVGNYLESLGPVLNMAFNAMPKRRKKARKVTDEEFAKVKAYLEERKVKFNPNGDDLEPKGT
jgi:hypothetical protein